MLGKNFLKNSRSNPILWPIITVWSQKKVEISCSTSARVGACSSFSTERPVIKLTILFSSLSGFSGRISDWNPPIIFPSLLNSTIPIWIGSSVAVSSPVVSKSKAIIRISLLSIAIIDKVNRSQDWSIYKSFLKSTITQAWFTFLYLRFELLFFSNQPNKIKIFKKSWHF